MSARCRSLVLLLCAAAIAGCQSTADSRRWELPPIQAASGEVSARYTELNTHKALAVALVQPNGSAKPSALYRYPVGGYATPSEAAAAAIAACEEARLTTTTQTSACEIRRSNDQWVHNTWELTGELNAARPAFLWRLDEDNTRVYVAGSIHVLKPTLTAPPSYFDAFNEADTLVLEVDQRNQAPEQMQLLMQQYALLPRDTTLPTLLSDADYSNAIGYLQNLGIDPTTANYTKPAMLLLQAGLLEYLSIGYLPTSGIESVFEKKLGNRALLGLETIEQQLQAATALPLELQAELLTETIREADTIAEQISGLVHAWLSGDASYLSQRFENSSASEAANRWLDDLLIKRNVGMAEGIEAMLRGTDDRLTRESPKVIFVLVGAAHLVGEKSVISLLQQRGIKTLRLRHNSLLPAASID